MRQIALDTETTGLDPANDRIVEIGCVEIIDRKIGGSWHTFVKPPVRLHPDAVAVHGLTDEFLEDKPRFSEIEKPFLEFLFGADEVLIHNAPFDLRFLNRELGAPNGGGLVAFQSQWKVVDTLVFARQQRPGQRNKLDTLAKHYDIENKRDGQHSALVDAELLARVYLAMTAGQMAIGIDLTRPGLERTVTPAPLALPERREIRVFLTDDELKIHAEFCRARGITAF